MLSICSAEFIETDGSSEASDTLRCIRRGLGRRFFRASTPWCDTPEPELSMGVPTSGVWTGPTRRRGALVDDS